MTSNINDIQLIEIPKITDSKGNLSVIEKDIIPFEIKRVFYLYDIRSDENRIGHAHKNLKQFLIVLSGSLEVVVNDGTNSKTITLNKPNKGLLLVPGIWRELQNFSSGCVLLTIASNEYNEADYIRNFDDFILFKNRIA